MFEWIADNSATVIAISCLLIIVGIAVFTLIRDKKKNPGGCTGNCASCGMACRRCQKPDE